MRLIDGAAQLELCRFGVLVPTMGALHRGHVALVRAAVQERDRRGDAAPVVVTIFVNPTQFNDLADLERYPRTLEADLAACREAGADVVFSPPREVVYPPDRTIPIPRLPAVATEPGLEDAARPGHFAGVCQVVARLFELTQPAAAVFGEKDWQQLQVIAAMTRQKNLSIRIIPVPIVRDDDGLALSSRNVFLTADDRRRGLSLPAALAAAAERPDPESAEAAMRGVLGAAGMSIDYAVVRDAETLVRFPGPPIRACRALIAARVGSVRLLDNAAWPAPPAASV